RIPRRTFRSRRSPSIHPPGSSTWQRSSAASWSSHRGRRLDLPCETAHAAEGLEASGHGGGQPEGGEARPGGNRESRGPHAVGGQRRSRSAEEGEALDRASGGGVSRDVPRRRKVLALRSRDERETGGPGGGRAAADVWNEPEERSGSDRGRTRRGLPRSRG